MIEKFGIYYLMPKGFDDLKDKKDIIKIKQALIRKQIQIKEESNCTCILVSGADVVRITTNVNGQRNKKLELGLAKQVKWGSDSSGELVLKIGTHIIATLEVTADTRSKRFVVEVTE